MKISKDMWREFIGEYIEFQKRIAQLEAFNASQETIINRQNDMIDHLMEMLDKELDRTGWLMDIIENPDGRDEYVQ